MAEQDGSSRNSSMMHLFLNCLAASAGAGLTYVRNIVPHLASRTDLRATILLTPALRVEFGTFSSVSFVEMETAKNSAKRFWQEQKLLPGFIRHSGADVLISTGNFALRNSPIPQILLSGNSLTHLKIFRAMFAAEAIMDFGWTPGSKVFLPSNPSAGLTARSPRVTPLLRNYGAGPASQRQ